MNLPAAQVVPVWIDPLEGADRDKAASLLLRNSPVEFPDRRF
jgi:hypothetical protein